MKKITNWRNATVADIEGDGLLDEITMIHVLVLQMQGKSQTVIRGSDHERLKKCLQWHIDNGVPIVGHWFIMFDIPALEKILHMDLSELMVIDTMALSWYLNTRKSKHGLGNFETEYGFPKVEVADEEWVPPTQEEGESVEDFRGRLTEHYLLMKDRCKVDVKINKCLWEDFKSRLIDMYTQSRMAINSGKVGGKRMSEDEVTYLDQFKGTTSVDEWIDNILTFLMFKMDMVRVKEATKWEADVPKITALQEELANKVKVAQDTLEAVMPGVPKYANKNFPKKPTKMGKKTKKNPSPEAELSKAGEDWNHLIAHQLGKKNDHGHRMAYADTGIPSMVNAKTWKEGGGEGVRIKVLKSYDPPNAGSSAQVKDLLYSHGWVPISFKYEEDKPAKDEWEINGKRGKPPPKRAIPQISIDRDDNKVLCPSVEKLVEKCPEIAAYERFTTIRNRLGVVNGWLKNLIGGKYLEARCHGFTNTLREQHTGLVNLPGNGKMYGEAMRGCLLAGKGNISLGSDLSSLEDRAKHHFMLPHDPDYVATMMADDYDPHILTAYSAGMITEEQYIGYKEDTLSGAIKAIVKKARAGGKTTNYACVYGAAAKTISIAADCTLAEAELLHTGYWKLNWSVEAIADEQYTFKCNKGKEWLVNPVNGFCYSLRSKRDKFSTLCQGTGSFFFDMWVDNVLNGMQEKFKVRRLNGTFHDEFIVSFRDKPKNREAMSKITLDSIEKVNEGYLLRRKLGCDIQYGVNYSEIH